VKSSGLNDPRLSVIDKRLYSVKRIIAVMSSKGGVGKTIIATTLSLVLNDRGLKTALLDLDFTNPSTHIVLGVNPLMLKPVEDKGIIPPEVNGLKYISITMFTGDKPLPLRGVSVDNLFRELLAITRWGELDYLVVDTPPGLGDEHLELLTHIDKRVEALIVTTPSPLSLRAINRLIEILRDGGYRILGVIGNMDDGDIVRKYCESEGYRFLGSIPFISDLDKSIGDIDKLKNTRLWIAINGIVDRITHMVY